MNGDNGSEVGVVPVTRRGLREHLVTMIPKLYKFQADDMRELARILEHEFSALPDDVEFPKEQRERLYNILQDAVDNMTERLETEKSTDYGNEWDMTLPESLRYTRRLYEDLLQMTGLKGEFEAKDETTPEEDAHRYLARYQRNKENWWVYPAYKWMETRDGSVIRIVSLKKPSSK